MANKYSKYELKPFMNTYVDSGAKEISQILSERFDKNKAKKDLVEQTLGSMDALEGDQHLVDRVKYKIQDSLKDIAATGAWEDATMAIDEAVLDLETDDGLLAAKKSMENRQAELNFIKEQTMAGNKVLDFGKSKAKNHSSYVYNKETSKWEDDVYQAGSETRLDYDAKMGKLLKTIKADSSGISRQKADGVAKGIYYTYSQSVEGQQDLRRLMELEYDQNIPEDERFMMAQKDIIRRIKGYTNQYIHTVAPKKSQESMAILDKYRNVSDAAMKVGFTATNINDMLQDGPVVTRLLDLQTKHLDAVQNGDMQTATDLMDIYEGTINSMYKQGKISKEELDIAQKYEMDLWSGEKDENGKPIKGGPNDVAFGNYVKYLTDDRVMPDFYLAQDSMWEDITSFGAKAATASAGTWVAGTGVLGAGAAGMAAAVSPLLLPAMAITATGYAVYRGLKAVTDNGNIRDTWRDGADENDDGQGVYSFFVDSEKEELLETVGDLDWMNRRLGLNYTEKDLPRLRQMAEEYYDYKVGRAENTSGEVNGDKIAEKFNDYDGTVWEGNSYTTSFSKDGAAASRNIDSIMAKHNVTLDNFRVLGVPEESKAYDKYTLDKDGNPIGKALKFNKIVAPSLMNNQPTRMVVETPSGHKVLVEAKKSNDNEGTYGIMESAADQMGLGKLMIMEGVVETLKDQPNPTYADVSKAVTDQVVRVANKEGFGATESEAIIKNSLRTLYMGIDDVQENIGNALKTYEQKLGRELTNEEGNRLVDEIMFNADNGYITNTNMYR